MSARILLALLSISILWTCTEQTVFSSNLYPFYHPAAFYPLYGNGPKWFSDMYEKIQRAYYIPRGHVQGMLEGMGTLP